ncbi:hypothetical protein J4423_00080 [Candidatus Pacearchaeota archaeon]|nr:hypothetical protein [Candidatus Pacearchaeota archaeon]
MKNYSGRDDDAKVNDLSRKLSDNYIQVIAISVYNGRSDKDIAEGTDWDSKYKVSPDIVEKAVERVRHTKRFMGYLLAERMNDRRRNALKSKGSRKDRQS